MLRFDHIAVVAPDLDEGIAYIGESLGITPANARTHVDMGTHNRRVRLGADTYLEVIAVDPDAEPPASPRWFGLDRAEAVRTAWSRGHRIGGWVARTDDIDAVLARHGHLLGSKRWLEGSFHFAVPADGSLPLGGVLPYAIDLAGEPPTAARLEDQGVRLEAFVLEHPNPEAVVALYDALGVDQTPTVVAGPAIRFSAEIETPDGRTVLLR
ncbi:VOC family protein [Salinarimonas rosea]|uniref:VOC family protein n=1 Tax=Salinarimonas rosea TaxID=552063 RepID=UPI000403C4A5|nr:VOC family protein [Salinarimonas rosea]